MKGLGTRVMLYVTDLFGPDLKLIENDQYTKASFQQNCQEEKQNTHIDYESL